MKSNLLKMDEPFENSCVSQLSKNGNIKVDIIGNVVYVSHNNNFTETTIKLSFEMWKRIEERINIIKKMYIR